MTTARLPHEILEPPGPADACVLWLHGLGADGHDFVPTVPHLGLPANHGIRFVFPHAESHPVSINGGFVMPSWYDIKDLALDERGDLEGLRRSAAQVGALLQDQRDAGIASERIILAGFSQGGAVAFHLGLRWPESLGGIMALSTYMVGRHTLEAERTEANHGIPILQCHGTHDPMVIPAWGETARDTLLGLGYDVTWKTWPMQHQVCMEQLDVIGAWLRARLLTSTSSA